MKTFRILATIVVLALAGNVSGQMLTNLYSFSGSDGRGPAAPLLQGSDGNFYGTTRLGGRTNLNSGLGYGTVFRISPTGSLTNLWLFTGGLDGGLVKGGLVQFATGDFYGTTAIGGNTNLNGGFGYGTIFRISPSGTLTSLYSFSSSDGANPIGELVQGNDGSFYGTTENGGTHGWGTVFRFSLSGTLTTLWNFCSFPNGPCCCLDGSQPLAGLVQGNDGKFYGTTVDGGTNFPGVGTVFRISPSGSFTTLWSFNERDGDSPRAGLVQGSDGSLYGTTFSGGTGPAGGNVFRINPSGSLTSLCSFGFSNGGYPSAGLVQGSDGNFYGVNAELGAFNYGTVFSVAPSSSVTTLYTFTGANDGAHPSAALVQGSDGAFYGTTFAGGSSLACTQGCGTVFKLIVPLSPPPFPINQITKTQVAATNIVFNVVSVAHETYQLQFTTNLTSGTWSNITSACVSNSIGATLTVTNFGGAVGPQGFCRFDITP